MRGRNIPACERPIENRDDGSVGTLEFNGGEFFHAHHIHSQGAVLDRARVRDGDKFVKVATGLAVDVLGGNAKVPSKTGGMSVSKAAQKPSATAIPRAMPR
jgi:hypothetical protein